MLNLLNYSKPLIVNGVEYPNSAEAFKALADYSGEIEVKINFKKQSDAIKPDDAEKPADAKKALIHRIKVRQYMTKPASPEFDFMKKFNNDIPMPLRVMYGEIISETKGMYQMKLHGRAEKESCHCMRCGRPLTLPTSRYYGLGIECINYSGISPDIQKIEEAEAIHRAADADLRKLQWTGWVIKSAIEEMTIIE